MKMFYDIDNNYKLKSINNKFNFILSYDILIYINKLLKIIIYRPSYMSHTIYTLL